MFADGELVAFAQSWAHFNDIGGMRAGSLSPDCTEIYQEGIIVPPVRVAREGVIDEELLRLFYRNSRFPEMVNGDMRALMAAIRLGERRLGELVARFGLARDATPSSGSSPRSARAARQLRALVPNGTYRFTDTVDSDGHGNGPIKLRWTLEVTPERIVLDRPGATTRCAAGELPDEHDRARHDVRVVSARREQGTHAQRGRRTAFDELRVREGSILQPRFPAPLGSAA